MKLDRHFDLQLFLVLAAKYTFRSSVIARAKQLTLMNDAETICVMRSMIASLTPGDFYRAHSEIYGGRGAIRLDAYAKVDDYGLWFVKFDLESDELVIHSCHESKSDSVELYNGAILVKP